MSVYAYDSLNEIGLCGANITQEADTYVGQIWMKSVELFCFYIVYLHRTGTALSDDNGRTLVTTAPRSRGRETT